MNEDYNLISYSCSFITRYRVHITMRTNNKQYSDDTMEHKARHNNRLSTAADIQTLGLPQSHNLNNTNRNNESARIGLMNIG